MNPKDSLIFKWCALLERVAGKMRGILLFGMLG